MHRNGPRPAPTLAANDVAAGDGSTEPATSSSPHRANGIGLWVFLAAVVVGGGVRCWLAVGRSPSWWQDSTDYASSARAGLRSTDLWLGARPPLVPLLLRLTGGEPGRGFVFLQISLAALAWAWLATELCWCMGSTRRSVAAAIVIVAFSLTDPVLQWDVQVLTESLTLALLAAVVAAVLRALRSESTVNGGLVVAGCVLLGLTRDAVVASLVVAGAAGAIAARRDRLVALGLVVVSSGLVLGAAATFAERDLTPMAHVYFARVLPYADRVAWFEDHGMPQANDLEIRKAFTPTRPGSATVVSFGASDPAFARWWAWFHEHGASTWRRYVATHPWYLVREPTREPERVFNNAGGSVAAYRPPDLPRVPLVSWVLWPATWLTVAGLVLVAGVARWRRLGGPVVSAAALVALAAAAYAAVAWHTDAMESARHLLISGAMARLALLVGIVGAVDAWRTATAADPPAS